MLLSLEPKRVHPSPDHGKFLSFYRDHYRSRPAKSSVELEEFPDGLSFSTEEQWEFLDSPITVEELGEALGALQNKLVSWD